MRILELAHDPLFASVDPSNTDWVQTGRPLEPVGRVTSHSQIPRTSLSRALWRASRGRYDLMILPAIRLHVPGDRRNKVKATTRRMLVQSSTSSVTAKVLDRFFSLSSTPHVIRDVGDFPEIEEVSTRLFPKARLYLKREVLEADIGRTVGDSATVVYTPMPFDLAAYQAAPGPATTDVFFAARLNSEHRRRAARVLERLAATEGLKVDIPSERLDFGEYLERMGAARLVVSPRGQGEHCYRHYEALLMGAVPVINSPDKPVYYALEHGTTALFHEPTDRSLAETIREALASPGELDRIAAAGAELVRTTHSKQAICNELLTRLGADSGHEPT